MLRGFSILSALLFLSTTDFSRTSTVTIPSGNNQKVIYAQKPAQPNPWLQGLGGAAQTVGSGVGNAAGTAAKGAGWFFSELLRPVEALRTGLIDAFGVPETRRRKN